MDPRKAAPSTESSTIRRNHCPATVPELAARHSNTGSSDYSCSMEGKRTEATVGLKVTARTSMYAPTKPAYLRCSRRRWTDHDRAVRRTDGETRLGIRHADS